MICIKQNKQKKKPNVLEQNKAFPLNEEEQKIPQSESDSQLFSCSQFLPTFSPLMGASIEASCMKALLFSSVKILRTLGRF